MFRFRNKKMNVFGHNDIAEDVKDVFPFYLFEGSFEEVAGGWVGWIWLAGVTTEGEEVCVAGLLVTLEVGGHG